MLFLLSLFVLPAQLGPVGNGPGQSVVSIERHFDGRPRVFSGSLFVLSPSGDPVAALAPWNEALGLDPRDRLRVIEDVVDRVGQRHIRLARERDGVAVEHDQVRVHVNLQGMATRVEIDLSVLRAYVRRAPAVSPNAAIDRARQGYVGVLDSQPSAVPVLLGVPHVAAARLAYRVLIAYSRIGAIPYVRDVYVDAVDGRVLGTLPRIYTQAVTMSDTDLDGVSRIIRVTNVPSRNSVVMQDLVSIPQDGIIGTLDGSRENVLYTTPGTGTSFGDPTAVSVHHGLRQSVEFFEREFGWTNWDFGFHPAGLGGTLVGIAHEGIDLPNAYFTVAQGGSGYVGVVAFGDGDGQFLTSLARCQDVATHELGHGLINATANLSYQFQSGALNEHFADVFGWLHDGDDDGIGEDCIGPALSTPLRDMCNPGSANDPQPADMSEFRDLPNTEAGDFGGVHINSGIPNRAACLTRNRIGADDLSRIWFRALRFHLGPTSDFAAMVDATMTSCSELELPSATCSAVSESWAQVGLSSGVQPPPRIDCPLNSTPVGGACYCTSGFVPTPDGQSCVPAHIAQCPSNSHREGAVCVCDECYQGLPDQNGTGCTPIPECTVCDSPVARSGAAGCECIPGIVEVCGPNSLDFEVVVDGQTVSGEICCQPSDPCGWAADGFCDCFGECSWNAEDCGETTPSQPECAARDFGNCGIENWAGRCKGNTLIYCDDVTEPDRPFIVYGDCGDIDRSCGFDTERQIFNCLELSCSLPPEGVCDGNTARWCANGIEQSLDCGDRPCTSYTVGGAPLSFCSPCGDNETLQNDECVCGDEFVRDAAGVCVSAIVPGDGPVLTAGGGGRGCAASPPLSVGCLFILLWFGRSVRRSLS